LQARASLYPARTALSRSAAVTPLDLADQFPQPFRWVSLGTRNATEATMLARKRAVEFDREMARPRVEAGRANGRLLREADIPVFAERFSACALRTDELERTAGLSESDWVEQDELIDTALKAGKNALARGNAG
jgi:hypothetical protein